MKGTYDLQDKVIVVTGGSQGLGAHMIKEFALSGANLVIVSRNVRKCEEIADEIVKFGVRAFPVKCDVSKLEEIDILFKKTMQEFSKIDILVNNAGIYRTKPDLEVTEEEWDSIFDVNLKGTFFCSQAAAKVMMSQNSGSIINIASATGMKPLKRMSPYTTSKAAIIHLTRSLALEWAKYSIRVNAIAPGIITTDINAEELGDRQIYEKTLKRIPLRRYGEPQDISSIALYLASDASNYVTGQTFTIDGGYLTE